MDINNLISKFIKDREQGIGTLHKFYIKKSKSLPLFIEELKIELHQNTIDYFNKKKSYDDINEYLFYSVNEFCKKQKVITKINYSCPGCSYLKKNNNNTIFDKYIKCNNCEMEYQNTNDIKSKYFFEVFRKHFKNGYRCLDCARFIPHPIDNSNKITCPYLDCLYVGTISDLRKMNHPTTSKFNIENNLIDPIFKQENHTLQLIKNVIDSLRYNDHYNSLNFTSYHKDFVYQAFLNLIDKFPKEMSSYLLKESNNYMGFQHKLFQEYIYILEKSLPLFLYKKKEKYKIESLLDNNLSLFNGVSIFDGVIDNKFCIKNETKEYYIGGRKGTYAKPFYIGKLLNIIDKKNKVSLLNSVKEYSFSKIYMQNVIAGTLVTVSHLRIPPHNQMGGMVYINRIRKKISDELLKENNEQS